jgi:hypothetical protein
MAVEVRAAAGRVTEALNLADAAVDDQLAKLLQGQPNCIYRAEITENSAEANDNVRLEGVWVRPASRRWRWIGRCENRSCD